MRLFARLAAPLAALLMLTACGGFRDDLTKPPTPIGHFLLGYNIVVAEDPQKGPFSRDATPDEWIKAVHDAIDTRFKRFDGDQYYHIAVAVQGYVLAQPGIPLIYSPKSVLIFSVTFYEDATQRKINEEPIQLTVFEPCCGVPFLGSGNTKSAQEQMEGLAFNAAKAIERLMRKHADWFGGTPEDVGNDRTIVEGNVLVDNPGAVVPRGALNQVQQQAQQQQGQQPAN
ncbi:hypothetical protein [Limimaricola sp.]|uniref:hypothetical protein n=1 Tax=Limimaricola sp. TaxID=2211665 RepID=UPI0025B8ED0F|nr:hypothetical protein [Limimaricola sp.]